MPWKATETYPVGGSVVVQARILSLEAVNRSVEANGFRAHFRYEVTGNVALETGRVGRFGVREES